MIRVNIAADSWLGYMSPNHCHGFCCEFLILCFFGANYPCTLINPIFGVFVAAVSLDIFEELIDMV